MGTGVKHELRGDALLSCWPSMGTMNLARITELFVMTVVIATMGCQHGNQLTIAVIPETTGDEFWESEHVGAERAGTETGYHVYWNAPTREDNIEQQIQLVEAATKARDAALVLAPNQYLALMTPVRRALASLMPVVVVRSPLNLPPEGNLAYVLNDEVETGRIVAMRIGDLMKGRGAVAVVGLNPAIMGIDDRRRAFKSIMAKAFPRIEVVDYPVSPLEPQQMQDSVTSILSRSPRIGAILALDFPTTAALLSLLQSRGQLDRVTLIGCDQDVKLMAALRSGFIDSIVAEDTNQMGYEGVREAAAMKSGKAVPPVLRVQPVLVTRQNIDQPDIQGILSTGWRQSR